MNRNLKTTLHGFGPPTIRMAPFVILGRLHTPELTAQCMVDQSPLLEIVEVQLPSGTRELRAQVRRG